MNILPATYYLESDPVHLAKDLLGKTLVSNVGGTITQGIIVETEAYSGATDAASHAYPNKRTKRTEIMFREGGVSYVYLCYGIHHLFNIVTNKAGHADAVLIRALEPIEGVKEMLKRRGKKRLDNRLTAGPGSLAKAMGITIAHNGLSLRGRTVWLEDTGTSYPAEDIIQTTRIGVDYAGEDALFPWRFYVKGSPYISKK